MNELFNHFKKLINILEETIPELEKESEKVVELTKINIDNFTQEEVDYLFILNDKVNRLSEKLIEIL